MKTSALVEQNNVKRTLLTPANKKMYEKILMYLRCEISLSDNQTEEVLNDLLDHLLEAQENNITTEEFFGEDPESFAKDLVAELPREKKNKLMKFTGILFFIFISTYLIFTNIFNLILKKFIAIDDPEVSLPGGILAGIILFLLFILLISWILKIYQKSLFTNKSETKVFIKIGIITFLASCIMYGIIYFILKYINIAPIINLQGIIPFIIGLICLIPPIIYFKKH